NPPGCFQSPMATPPGPPPTFLIPERSRPAARPARTCRTACRALERHLEPGGKHPVRRLEPRLREVVEPDGVAQLHRETPGQRGHDRGFRSEEHTSELQSRENLVCRLLLEK